MANSPYLPAPSVGPSSEGTPYMRVPAATEEAAGVGTARAVQNFGKEISQIGDMVAQHALSLQHIVNETDAKNADVQTMIAIGQATSEFDQLQGENAIKALPKFQQTVEKIRQDSLAKMANPEARRMLDASISRRVGFSLVDAGHKAGTQLKAAARTANASRLETAIADYDPDKAGSFELSRDTIKSTVADITDDQGVNKEVRSNMERKAMSKMFLNGIKKQSVLAPEKAQALFESVKEQLDPETRDAAQIIVDRQMAAKQTLFDAQKILGKFDVTAGEVKLTEAVAEAKRIGEEKYPNNANAQWRLLTLVESGANLAKKIYNDRQRNNFETVMSFIHGQKPEDKIVDVQALYDPNTPAEIRDAFNDLPTTKQRQVENYIKQPVRDIPLAGEALKRYRELVGLASHSPEEFADVDVLNEQIPERQKTELYKKQLAQGKQAEANSDTGRYVGWAKRVMDYYKVFPSRDSQSKQKQYLEFVGALEVEINEFKEQHKKAPGQKDVETMAKGIGQQVITSEGKIFDSKARRFEIEVPAAEAKRISDEYLKTKGQALTKAEIRYIYYRQNKFKEVPNGL